MATSVIFDGVRRFEPGVYIARRGETEVQPIVQNKGICLLIEGGDDIASYGTSITGYGGGSGINGTNKKGGDAICAFDSLGQFRDFVGGGQLWSIAEDLFLPSGGRRGINRLIYARAATTTPSELTLALDSGEFIRFGTVDEGSCTVPGFYGGDNTKISNLARGYSAVLEKGRLNQSKYILKFYRGIHRGVDKNNVPYEDVNSAPKPIVVCASPEVSTFFELFAWTQTDKTFAQYFSVIDSEVTASSESNILADDFTALSTPQLFAGGTTEYNASNLDKIIESLEFVDFDYILLPDKGVTSSNTKLAQYANEAERKKSAYCAGGDDDSECYGISTSSAEWAKHYNGRVVVVHSGAYINYQNRSGDIFRSSKYVTASVLGLTAGYQTEASMTYKGIKYKKLIHLPTAMQRDELLKAGVLHFKNVVGKGVVINQEINSLINNTQEINSDGTSPNPQIVRIQDTIEYEILTTLRANYVGENVNANDIAETTQYILNSKKGTLIIDGVVTSVRKSQDNFFISYLCTVVNATTKIFITSTYKVQ